MTTQTRAEKKAARIASDARIAAAHLEAQAALTANRCPCCGLPVKRNSALTGWVQCVAYACPSFRAPEYRDAPACGWQGLTQ